MQYADAHKQVSVGDNWLMESNEKNRIMTSPKREFIKAILVKCKISPPVLTTRVILQELMHHGTSRWKHKDVWQLKKEIDPVIFHRSAQRLMLIHELNDRHTCEGLRAEVLQEHVGFHAEPPRTLNTDYKRLDRKLRCTNIIDELKMLQGVLCLEQ